MIDQEMNNADYQTQLENNINFSKIRSIFDVEFNKHLQGSITLPLKGEANPRSSTLATGSSSGCTAQKYLFFLADKFTSES